MKRISSISVFYKERRIKIRPTLSGKFKIPGLSGALSFTPKELIQHPAIKNLDPWITTSDGSKMRVYQGGDSRQMVIETISFIESCEPKDQKKTYTPRPSLYSLSSEDYPWEDFSDWD